MGELFVEGERFNVQRLYQNQPIDPTLIPPRIFSSDVPFDPYNARNLILVAAASGGMSMMSPGMMPNTAPGGPAMASHAQHNTPATSRNATSPQPSAALNPTNNLVYNVFADAVFRDMQIAAAYQSIQQTTQNLQQRLAQDIQMVDVTNAQITEVNGRVLPVLKLITGQDLGVEPEKWKTWWTDQLGYVYQSNVPQTKPTFTDMVSVQAPFTVGGSHCACFAAGTLVATLDGPQAIESVQVGDRVLSQDTTTGQLTFQPVVAVHRNQPSPTLRIVIDGETIVATGIHRFWKAGKGWTMARELKPDDPIRVVGSVLPVQSVKADATQPVYNLDVAENRDFFVGTKAILVHDYSFVQPVLAPFDRSSPSSPLSANP
jgi:hypothetical protein